MKHSSTGFILVPTHFVRLLRLPEDVKRRYDLSSIGLRRIDRLALPARVKNDDRLVGPVIKRELREQRGRLHHGCCRRRNRARIRARPGVRLPGAEVRIMSDAARCCRPMSPG